MSQATRPSLTILDAVGRGLSLARANLELVLVQFVQLIVVGVLVVLGVVPPLLVSGFESFQTMASSPPEELVFRLAEWATEAGSRYAAEPLAAIVAFSSTLAIWGVAFLVACYFLGGTFGILVSGDRQAPAGAGQTWRWFRTFSVRDFMGWGGRYVWRYFWLLNLFLGLFALATLFVAALAAMIAWAVGRWGGTAGIGIGCGAALPLLFLALAFAGWSGLAQADLAEEDSRTRVAARRAVAVLGRRLGGVTALVLLLFVASFVVSTTFQLLAFAVDLALADHYTMGRIVALFMILLQWFASAALSVVWAAVLVALQRSERRALGV